jgi:FixJ family two-component response regulator
MGTALTIHFVDEDDERRADSARLFMALGHHAEVYADFCELLRHPPQRGIIVAHEAASAGGASDILAAMDMAGISLPLVLASESGEVGQVVDAMAAGAFDYLKLPIESEAIAKMLQRAANNAEEHSLSRRRMIEARALVDMLSTREREVFLLLVEGGSNKLIARSLDISPRTVEIHRANMMQKLGVSHVAAAVRLYLDAQLGA